MTRAMPFQRPGVSEQVVCTPDDFLAAFVKRFGLISFDLAATCENSVLGVRHFGPGGKFPDALTVEWWRIPGNLWLNPPFDNIRAFAVKAREGGRVSMLVPLSSARWAVDHCWGVGMVYPLFPRLKFKGHSTSYPKDLMLVQYGPHVRPGCESWVWR